VTSSIPTIGLVGVGGFGRHHLANIQRLSDSGVLRLTGLVDPAGLAAAGPDVPAVTAGVPVYPTLDAYLAHEATPTVVVVATPIQTHTGLALTALAAGAHVLLEKPPTPGTTPYARLTAAAAGAGRVVQVGFQSFGSLALPRLAGLIAAGELGQLRGIGGVGTWSRPAAYYSRSPWAGKRVLDGQPVVDGVVTNPLAHAVATALKIAGATRADQVASVTVDLHRANPIDSDDTSAVNILTDQGLPVALGLALTAPQETLPRVIVRGSRGSATLHYVSDQLDLDIAGRQSTEHFGRTDLTENLLAHLADPATALLSPLADAAAFMQVLEAVRTAPDPKPIPEPYVSWQTHDGDRWAVVADVESWCERVAAEATTFADLGAPWA